MLDEDMFPVGFLTFGFAFDDLRRRANGTYQCHHCALSEYAAPGRNFYTIASIL
jgi:hypothetical protein